MSEIKIPEMGLVVLVGVSGSGKSQFAARHFLPTEVVSSDVCRALVSDDENDQDATPDAFEVLHAIAGVRLRRGKLTVVDATNVQQSARAELVKLARQFDVLVDAIVLNVPESVAKERHERRTDRDFGVHVIERQARDLRRSLKRLRREGFRRVHILDQEAIDAAVIVREPAWNDKRDVTGPFDIIGDVHGCRSELESLLGELGWVIERERGVAVSAHHPEGRQAVFVGDLVDRGPDTPGVLRLVMGMVEAGHAFVVAGNHEVKLVRALKKGSNVKPTHGTADSLRQFEAEPVEFVERAQAFMDGLISHYVFDGGKLVVAHAGLKEAYHGRSSGRVRAFALYGDTTGETDEYGLPVRYPWAEEYRGSAMVVHGHTPVPEAIWINNTICLDTGCVFGGELTALRYPERELVAVPAEKEWYAPIRPLVAPPVEREPSALRADDVLGTRWLDSRAGRVKIPEENAAAALEVMSRFAVDPRWLIYLPPTMSPAASSSRDGYLEYPDEAFAEFERWGVKRVVCEEKHMGSRAIAVIAKDETAARERFGVEDGSACALYTRTGRPFFEADTTVLDELREAVRPLMDEFETDWIALDCELLPWSAKALPLIKDQYASVGAAATHALPAARAAIERAAERGLDVSELGESLALRESAATSLREAYRAYVGMPDEIRVAPFQILAVEDEVFALSQPHEWHMSKLATLTHPIVQPTRHGFVDLSSAQERADAAAWWEELTAAGGEGMVVKPAHLVGPKTQPGLKVRGREYLRIIYGPDYLSSLPELRNRNLGKKRSLAIREHGLGLDALEAFVTGEPLWKVHQKVFAVLALESEGVDPRL